MEKAFSSRGTEKAMRCHGHPHTEGLRSGESRAELGEIAERKHGVIFVRVARSVNTDQS